MLLALFVWAWGIPCKRMPGLAQRGVPSSTQGHRSGPLAAFTQDEKVWGKKPEKEFYPRRPCGWCCKGRQSWWPGSPCSLNQLWVRFLRAGSRMHEVKVQGRAAWLAFKSVLNPGRARGQQPWPWGCAWSPPALWWAAPGKGMSTPGLGEKLPPCKGWDAARDGMPHGMPHPGSGPPAPARKRAFPQVAAAAVWCVTGHRTRAPVQP